MSAKNTKAAAKSRAKKRRTRHEEPSAASLREIPPIDFTTATVLGRGPEGLRKGLEWLKRGRPKKGETAEGTSVKSVRLPDRTWKELERVAKKRGVTLHALLREAIAKVLAA